MKSFILLLVVLFYASLVFGQQSTVLEKVKEKLKNVKTEERTKRSTAIAGVRGEENKEEEKLFWMGKDSVTKEELELFKSGINKIDNGDIAGGKEIFEIFLNKHPKSALSPDAYEILKTLK